MWIILLYLLNTLIALCVAYAAIDPGGCRRTLEQIGLWPLIERLEAQPTRHLLGFLGKLLIVLATALMISVMLGHHGTAWLLPAGQAALLGFLAWVGSALGDKL